MGSSLGYGPAIAISQYLVVYERTSQTDGSWRGYYESFDELADAEQCAERSRADGYKCAIFDIRQGLVVSPYTT